MGLSKQGMSIRGGGWMSSQDYNDLTCYNQNLNNDFTEDKWLDQKTTAKWRQEQRKKIIEFYKNCPEGYEVDHKHPLSKGGLHVDYNLQAIPKSENRRKGTKIL